MSNKGSDGANAKGVGDKRTRNNRHQLLKRRQQQRRAFQERNNLVKDQIQGSNGSSTYNFTPVVPLDDLVQNGTLERGRTLSASLREIHQRAKPSEINIEDAMRNLAQKVSDSQSSALGIWKRLPHTPKPILKSTYSLGIGQEKEDNLLQFRTTLPPLVKKPNETFRDAIFRKDIEAFRELICLRRDQKTLTSSELNHALLIAINRRETEMAEVLLMSGADPCEFEKYNPLIVQAAFTNNAKMVELLLRFGAEPNLQADPQYTPLYFACHRDNFNMVQILVKNGADVGLASREKITPLMAAARVGNIKCVRFLVFHCPDNINSKDTTGKTALHYAAASGKRRVVEFLLKRGSERFVVDTLRVTPFITARMGHHNDIAELLLPKDIEQRVTDPKTGFRNTMLYHAVKCGHTPSVQYLINKGLSVMQASDGNPYLIIKHALEKKNLELVRILAPLSDLSFPVAEKGNSIVNAVQYYLNEIRDDYDENVLPSNDFEIVQCLIGNGAAIDAFLPNDSSFFLDKCCDFSPSKLKCLVLNGSNPNVVYEDGTSALWLACKDINGDLIETLINCNFDMTLSQKKHMGHTPFHELMLGRLINTDTLIRLLSAGLYIGGISDFLDNVSIVHTNGDPPSDTWGHLLQIMRERARVTRSLQEVCKLEIKKHLGHKDVDKDIDQLPLPPSMKDYLRPGYIDGHLVELMDY